MQSNERIRTELISMADSDYKTFHSRLMPTVSPEKIIGIRIPVLRKYALGISDSDRDNFMADLPHKFYEENNLHAFLIEKKRDFKKVIKDLDKFLPYVDNWATCDSMNPKVLGTNREALLPIIDRWLKEEHAYTVRYAIGLLMRYYLGDNFKTEYSDRVASVNSEEYYVKMMVAWYFATALAYNYDLIISYIESHVLDDFTHRKCIQKALESYRISDSQKEYLRKLKVLS